MSTNPELRVLLSCRLINDVTVNPEGVISFDLNCLKSDVDAMCIIPKKSVKEGDMYTMKLVA